MKMEDNIKLVGCISVTPNATVMWQKDGSMNNEQYSYIFDEKKKSLSVGQKAMLFVVMLEVKSKLLVVM